MSGLARYMATGWSPRFGYWVTELYECTTMEAAKKRFITANPTLKHIKIHALRELTYG